MLSGKREETYVKNLKHQSRAMPWCTEGILVLENSWFRSQLISIAFCVIMKEGIVLEALATVSITREWIIIIMTEEIGVTVLIIFKCCPSLWVAAMFLSGSISHILHLSDMVFEFFLHDIQHNITISITPRSSTLKNNPKEK